MRVTGLPPHKVTQLGMARTFQNIRLFHNMTRGRERAGRDAQRTQGRHLALDLPHAAPEARGGGRRARARELLVYCGLARRQHDEYGKNLPYGDQRRLEVARALATEPVLLLLDEPTAGMNPQETARLHRLRPTGCATSEELTVLLIEHDMKLVMDVSDRVTVLDYGQKISEGTPAEVQQRPARDRGLSRERRRPT